MKWIKASEQLPKIEGDYVCRLIEKKGVQQVRNVEFEDNEIHKEFWLNDVDVWLYETLIERQELLQIFQDFSEQDGETYEQRSIMDSYFGDLADAILKKIK